MTSLLATAALILITMNSVIAQIEPKSRCSNYGTYNSKCTSHDYCNKSMGLMCGDGFCGLECPNGWIVLNDTCYYFQLARTKIENANAICKNQSAKLLSVKTKNELMRILNVTSNLGSPSSIWLSAFETANNEFTYTDGTKLFSNDSLWNSPNDPYNYFNEDCVAVMGFGAVDVACGSWQAAVICELQKSCTKSVCNCGKDKYFDDLLNQCVAYGTFNECCENDTNCNANQGLYCMDGQCVCPDGTNWDVYAQMCKKCCYTIFACENNTLSVNCWPNRIQVIQAFYGHSENRCGYTGSGCRASNSKTIVKSICEGNYKCSFIPSFSVFQTDPCPNITKYSYLTYGCY